ncbi:MAG: hypothetical protein NTY23_12435, partial [Chloroflexi bacterium]|nr:hypothetical protein [Chloroflexota bacterium]
RRAVASVVLVEKVEAWIMGELAAGTPAAEIELLTRWPAYDNSVTRCIMAVRRARGKGKGNEGENAELARIHRLLGASDEPTT